MSKPPPQAKITPPGPKPAGILLASAAVTVVVVVVRAPNSGACKFTSMCSPSEPSHIKLKLPPGTVLPPLAPPAVGDWDANLMAPLKPKHIADLDAAHASLGAAGGVAAVALGFTVPPGLQSKSLVKVLARVGYGSTQPSQEESQLFVEELTLVQPNRKSSKPEGPGQKESQGDSGN